MMDLPSTGTPGLWIGFTLFVLALLALDLGVFHRRAHEVRFREALAWNVVWIVLPPLQRLDLLAIRRKSRTRVPDRLPHREGARRRQHLHLPRRLLDLRGAGGLSVPGSLLGHPWRAGPAGGVHPARRRIARSIPLGDVRLRGVPGAHRHQTPPGGERRGALGTERPLPALQAARAVGVRLPRGPLHDREGGPSMRHTAPA